MSERGTLLDDWQAVLTVCAMPDLSDAAKLVFIRLVDHRNARTGQCNPSYPTLAHGTGKSRRRVITAIGELEQAGLLTVNRSTGGDPNAARGYVSNSYRIIPPVPEMTPGGVSQSALPPGDETDTPPRC